MARTIFRYVIHRVGTRKPLKRGEIRKRKIEQAIKSLQRVIKKHVIKQHIPMVLKVWEAEDDFVQNASDQPIWEVGVNHWALGDSKFTHIPVIPAGGRREFMVRPKREGETLEEAVTVSFRDNAGRSWRRPASVPGFLDLEEDNTFAELEDAQPPIYYRAQSFKTWVEERWPKREPTASNR